jgi:hypothetical protein
MSYQAEITLRSYRQQPLHLSLTELGSIKGFSADTLTSLFACSPGLPNWNSATKRKSMMEGGWTQK